MLCVPRRRGNYPAAPMIYQAARCFAGAQSCRLAPRPGLAPRSPLASRPGRAHVRVAGPARRASTHPPGALQPSQDRPSIARGFGKGSAGFRCQMSHIAGMGAVPRPRQRTVFTRPFQARWVRHSRLYMEIYSYGKWNPSSVLHINPGAPILSRRASCLGPATRSPAARRAPSGTAPVRSRPYTPRRPDRRPDGLSAG